MAFNAFDLYARITLDTGEYEKNLNDAGKKSESLQKEFKQTAKSSETLQNKLIVLTAQHEKAQKEVDKLTEAFNKSAKEKGYDSEETQELAEKLKNAEENVRSIQKEMDELTETTEKAGEKFENSGGKISKFAEKLKSGLATAAKVGAAALGAAATAVGALAKASLDAYADQEQLVGGVETLFGAGGKSLEQYAEANGKTVDEVKDQYERLMQSQQTVLDNAARAYETAGMSANEYMETVTGFSASLLQSLGGDTQRAAEVADVAITDMADNANKMGTSMESIQYAYQGFAKQNYTMLDNLKLGYGGTKEEMERLIADANALKKANGEMADLTIDSYADVVEAIHLVQTEMGITGTTHDEAAKTIQGSLSAMKSAWKNLVAGIADENADLDKLIDNFVKSVGTAAENIVPRLRQILTGLGTMVQKLVPIISEQLPEMIEKLVPSLLNAGASLLTGLINGVIQALPSLIGPATDIIIQLGAFIVDNLPLLIDAAAQIIIQLAYGLAEALPDMIPQIVQVIVFIGQTLIEHIPELLDAAGQIIKGIAKGMLIAFPDLVAIWESLKSDFAETWEVIKETWSEVTGFFSNIWSGIKSAFNFSEAFNWGRDLIQNFINGIKEKISALVNAVGDVAGKIRSFMHFSEPDEGPLKDFSTYAPDMMKLFAKGIADNAGLVQKQLDKSLDFDFGIMQMGTVSGATIDTENTGRPGVSKAAGSHIEPLAGAPITININGANIQNDQELAERISFELQMLMGRRSAAFGTA